MARVIQAACGEPKKALQNAAKAEAQNNFQAAGVIQAVCGEKMNALLNATKAEVNGYWATAGIIQAVCGKPNKIHKIIALCWMY